MRRLKLKPAEIAKELLELNGKMLKSLETLSHIEHVDVGSTPSEQVYQEDKLVLRYYPPQGEHIQKQPLLIVYALVNRPYILDLQPDRSLIRSLTEQGIPVYLIDWGYPDRADRYLDLDDYINGYIDNCVNQVLDHSGQSQLNLMGVCQGGTFSLCYTAINPEKVRSLITVVTPVDFHTADNVLAHLAKGIDAELILSSYGNFPGQMLAQAYNALMPARLGLQKQLGLPMQLEYHTSALNFLRMEKWINDSPDLAGQAFLEFLEAFFIDNRFINGALTIGSEPVDLGNIEQPVLNLYASKDHLVPPAASQALRTQTNSKNYTEHAFNGGHIGIFVGRQSHEKLPTLVAEWLTKPV
ncbi:MAG: class III poly(R)-hydroxyalkanoic acid synthase subunit PhaC [Motiliproteus sp.]|nr:class III poly(R)-hydroxyalkanoic acid synthase subunit PhaC [Motiliproteus sp.]MCW9051125.1 class III poly(R)-hydroxyalkanoic acid synthase subunit PhaC [Motiliproteus sp.]